MAAINRADIAMVLVSQAFLNSDYIQNHEIRSSLVRRLYRTSQRGRTAPRFLEQACCPGSM